MMIMMLMYQLPVKEQKAKRKGNRTNQIGTLG
jgi:hypothetical protein